MARTQYILFNNSIMKNIKVLDSQAAAHELTVKALKKADNLFYRQRRAMEDTFGMPHGVFAGV